MKAGKLLSHLSLAMLVLGIGSHSHATPTPGVAINASQVSLDATKVVNLAQQVFPELFSGASGWHLFEGFQYRFFANTGTYIGFRGSDVYVLGGPFGDSPVSQGRISDALSMLQSTVPNTLEAFRNVVGPVTVAALIGYFKEITLEYVAGSGIPKASVALEVLGRETINGAATDKVRVTVSGGLSAAPISAFFWVNGDGVVTRFEQQGFVLSPPQSDMFANTIVSGMLIALGAADTPTVRAAISNQLADNQAVTRNMGTGSISGIAVKTLSIEVSTAANASIKGLLSDFGAFSLMTSFQSQLGFNTTSFEIRHVVLR